MTASMPCRLLAAILSATPIALAAPQTQASEFAEAEMPDASLTLKGHLLAVGIGYKWGRGTLDYEGQQLQFCIRGLSIGDVGIARLEGQGAVFKLSSLEDFEG